MPVKTRRFPGLTGNQLKLIAMVAMTADHVGLQLLPQLTWLRWIGRLAMPLYAFMIAEGWRHTRSRNRYFLSVALMALVCQAVYWVAMGSVYQCILVTFSLSMGLMFLWDRVLQRPDFGSWGCFLLGLATVIFITQFLPGLLPQTDFRVDYDIWGVLLPLLVYMGKDRPQTLLFAGIGLLGLSLDHGGRQWLGMLTLPLLALYNHRRGKANIKYLFYFYYPVHLVLIYLLSLFL